MTNYLRLLLVTIFSCTLSFQGLNADDKTISPTKEQRWVEMMAEVDTWVDGIGYRMDQGIKETVAALNLLGIQTAASCEGHLDHGCSHPWIDIKLETPEYLAAQLAQIEAVRKALLEEELFRKNNEGIDWWDGPESQRISDLFIEANALTEKAYRIAAKTIQPVLDLLEDFYPDSYSSYDRLLIVQQSLGRIQSLGGTQQDCRTDEEKAAKLAEYRSEMDRFTEFLKKRYFLDADQK